MRTTSLGAGAPRTVPAADGRSLVTRRVRVGARGERDSEPLVEFFRGQAAVTRGHSQLLSHPVPVVVGDAQLIAGDGACAITGWLQFARHGHTLWPGPRAGESARGEGEPACGAPIAIDAGSKGRSVLGHNLLEVGFQTVRDCHPIPPDWHETLPPGPLSFFRPRVTDGMRCERRLALSDTGPSHYEGGLPLPVAVPRRR